MECAESDCGNCTLSSILQKYPTYYLQHQFRVIIVMENYVEEQKSALEMEHFLWATSTRECCMALSDILMRKGDLCFWAATPMELPEMFAGVSSEEGVVWWVKWIKMVSSVAMTSSTFILTSELALWALLSRVRYKKLFVSILVTAF